MKHLSKVDDIKDNLNIESLAKFLVGQNLIVLDGATPNSWLGGDETYPNVVASRGQGAAVMKEAIPVIPGMFYTFSKNEEKEFFRISWLDDNYRFISRYPFNQKVNNVIAPNNAAYCWVSYPINSDPKMEIGRVATPYTLSLVDITKRLGGTT